MRKHGFIHAGKILRTCLAHGAVAVLMGILLIPSSLIGQAQVKKQPEQALLAIYKEVLELGYRDQEDFLKREFHFNLDGSMANREEHIVVLSHASGSGEKMILQVTYFGEDAHAGAVRYPKLTREISCLIQGNTIEIQESMFERDESLELFPEILKGIQDEKKYLKLLKRNN
ncbi:MAG: hypothetical protein ACERK6_04135 [Candidatus Aminicenantaceae bacterium]